MSTALHLPQRTIPAFFRELGNNGTQSRVTVQFLERARHAVRPVLRADRPGDVDAFLRRIIGDPAAGKRADPGQGNAERLFVENR